MLHTCTALDYSGPVGTKNVHLDWCFGSFALCTSNKKASIRWQDSARRQFQAGL